MTLLVTHPKTSQTIRQVLFCVLIVDIQNGIRSKRVPPERQSRSRQSVQIRYPSPDLVERVGPRTVSFRVRRVLETHQKTGIYLRRHLSQKLRSNDPLKRCFRVLLNRVGWLLRQKDLPRDKYVLLWTVTVSPSNKKIKQTKIKHEVFILSNS